MHGKPYSDAENFVIRRMFRSGRSDAEIAAAVCQAGRKCGSEAIRRHRRGLGLKKAPTYQRWVWSPTFSETRT